MRRLLSAFTLLVALSSCTEALLQPELSTESVLDDRLQIRGKVCTEPPDTQGFPVKVVFLIDSSGSMCVSDGPGSQASAGLCEQVGPKLAAMGITVPGRVRALKSVLQRFRTPLPDGSTPNISVALIPFDSKITNVYPQTGFVSASDGSLDTRVDGLQNALGKGTDYQGALAEAYSRIEADILKANRSELPRTKYVVILFTDGAPYPRCTSDDNDADPTVYATPARPWGIWRDNPPTFCNPVLDANGDITLDPNLLDPNGDPTDPNNQTVLNFTTGADRNQNYQIFDAADRMTSLRDKYNIGEIKLHTIMLFNTEAVALLGEIGLRDLYNLPGATAEEAREVSRWILTELAVKHGNGTFQEFTTAADIELGSLDYTSLASRFVQKSLLVQNTAAFPLLDGPKVDSDGDGIEDDRDAEQVLGTSRLSIDSDQDGFPDAFEASHKSQGFDPLTPDPRGCKSVPGVFTAPYSCADSDGDLLSQAAEAYLGTDPTLADTDTDGMPDGVEVTLGLDPLTTNGLILDRDLDGVADVLEVFQHTNPLLDDRLIHACDSYRTEVKATPQANGSVCYDFLVSNIRLLTPDRASGQHGYNYITLTFGEAPEGSVSRDYGLWKMACVFAQFAPPSLRMPSGPELTVAADHWQRLSTITRSRDSLLPANYQTLCTGAVP
ncbi:MAG TPA: VWA domain-containing protein [Myxococcales bacterium]|jgi:hypothetical protein